jgi:NAD(P)-dependent dehydrogenase (short-subunit alcohol dehydrogenase family)
MAHVFITGSTDGLGRAAARRLIDDGHKVVLHSRSRDRASALADLAPLAAGVVFGDLADASETRGIAEQVNALGRMDAVIHNAGVHCADHARRRLAAPNSPALLTGYGQNPDLRDLLPVHGSAPGVEVGQDGDGIG